MCSMAAAVQGMDETVNNGAQAIYLKVGAKFHYEGRRIPLILSTEFGY